MEDTWKNFTQSLGVTAMVILGFTTGFMVVEGNRWFLLLALLACVLLLMAHWMQSILGLARLMRPGPLPMAFYLSLLGGLGVRGFVFLWQHNLILLGLLALPFVVILAVLLPAVLFFSALGLSHFLSSLPGNIRDRIWDFRLNRQDFPAWLSPEEHGVDTILQSGVLTIVEVRQSGEDQEEVPEQHQVRLQEAVLFTGDIFKAEEWLLARYRAYRRGRNLRIAPEAASRDTEIWREWHQSTLKTWKDTPLPTEADLMDMRPGIRMHRAACYMMGWTHLDFPSARQVMKSCPGWVDVWLQEDPGSQSSSEPYRVWYQRPEKQFFQGHGKSMKSLLQEDIKQLERVEIVEPGCLSENFPSLEAAEEEVLMRYQTFRNSRGLNPYFYVKAESSWGSSEQLTENQIWQFQPFALKLVLPDQEACLLHFDDQGEVFGSFAAAVLSEGVEFRLYDGAILMERFATLNEARAHLLTLYEDLKRGLREKAFNAAKDPEKIYDRM